jgi:two-component system chemotaxis sensor kinase CheA
MSEQHQEYSTELAELWAIFAQEGRENLDLVEETLLKLEAEPTDRRTIAELFRAIHTFKGDAHMMGLPGVELLAHHAEDLVALVRDDGIPLSRAMIDLLLEILDRLRELLIFVVEQRRDIEPAQIEAPLQQLQAMLADPSPPAPLPGDCKEEGSALPQELPSAEPLPEPDATGFEKFDLMADFGYVRIFLEMAQEEMSRLQLALDRLMSGDESAAEEIKAVVESMKYATEQIGYERMTADLEELLAAIHEPDDPHLPSDRTIKLKKIQLALFEQLTAIQEMAPPAPSVDEPELPDVAWLFRHWCVERVFADLTRLADVAEELEQFLTEFLTGRGRPNRERQLADEAAYLLRTIYHSCVFYQIEPAAHLCLALQDLYARILQTEMPPNRDLIELTRAYIRELGGTIEAIYEGQTPNLDPLSAMIDRSQQILYRHTEGRVYQASRDILDLLDLPPAFQAVLSTESLLILSQSLQAGERFYTILADLERQGEQANLAFYEWLQSEPIHLITSITVYQGEEHALFSFLLATAAPPETLLEELQTLDPDGTYLVLTECRQKTATLPRPERSRPPSLPPPTEVAASSFSLAKHAHLTEELRETVGELVATKATLRRIVERLAESELLEKVTRLTREANGYDAAPADIELLLTAWDKDVRALVQVETEIGLSLDHLQEIALALRARPAAEILAPLPRLAQDVAAHQGKMVTVETGGEELELDHTLLEVLSEPLRRLTWFAAAQGIESPAERQEAGKSPIGQISITIHQKENRVKVTLKDDGRGLPRPAILKRARELGWTEEASDGDTLPMEILSEWLLREELGTVGEEAGGINLAAIGAALRPHHGRLTIASEPGRGSQFVLDLPQAMAVMDGMVVRVGRVQYALPVEAIRRIVKPQNGQITHTSADGGGRTLRLGAELAPIRTLPGDTGRNILESLILVVEQNEQIVALPIDELIGQQQLLVRPLQGYLAEIEGVSGCALLGDGEIGVVLDLHSLVI